MNVYADDIVLLRHNCRIHKYQNEISALKDNKGNKVLIKKLEDKLDRVKNRKKIKLMKNSLDKDKKDDSNPSLSLFRDVDKFLYRKQWARLPEFHRIVKIKEYINSINELNPKQKKDFVEKIIKKIHSKEIKNKNIVYDMDKEKIIKITGVGLEKIIKDEDNENNDNKSDSNNESESENDNNKKVINKKKIKSKQKKVKSDEEIEENESESENNDSDNDNNNDENDE